VTVVITIEVTVLFIIIVLAVMKRMTLAMVLLGCGILLDSKLKPWLIEVIYLGILLDSKLKPWLIEVIYLG
jgi:hypothetical protein